MSAQSAEQAAQLAYQQAYQLYQQQAAAQLQQQVGSNQKYKSTLCNICQYYTLWSTTPAVTAPVK
uniref:DNA-binding protein n=1 Tax=Meloidogyne hapla TaxID=6305 RepID=A0A1I8BC48_MELHA